MFRFGKSIIDREGFRRHEEEYNIHIYVCVCVAKKHELFKAHVGTGCC